MLKIHCEALLSHSNPASLKAHPHTELSMLATYGQPHLSHITSAYWYLDVTRPSLL